MTNTWYERNKEGVKNLLHKMSEIRMSNALEGLFEIKEAEACITMLIGDSVLLRSKVEQLEKELEIMKKGQNPD